MFVCCIIVQTGRHLFEKTIPFKNSGAETIYDSLTSRASGENFTAETSITPIPCESKEGPISLIPTIYFKDTIVPIPRSFIRNKPQLVMNITNDGWFGESITEVVSQEKL